MIWLFLAVALWLAVVSAGFRKFLIWGAGSIVGLWLLLLLIFGFHP